MPYQRHSIIGYYFFVVIAVLFVNEVTFAQEVATNTMDVGVARIDITPETSIRLAGYASRSKAESDGVMQRLYAKALAFGTDAQHPSILLTVDLVGIPGSITSKVLGELTKKKGINPAQVVICASHTHGGPEVGNLMNILQYRGDHFSDSLLALDQLIHIAQYTETLTQKLEQVALAALNDRRSALVAWGQGQAGFAANRRTKGGPVDPALPILRITNPDGTLRAVFVNYACHGTTLDGNVNEIHGDWIAEAQRIMEAKHPGVQAMVALGCAGDANPQPRGKVENMQSHGQEISDNVDKLLTAQLEPLTTPPVGSMKWIKLPFSKVPNVDELIELSKDKSVKGFYARRALDKMERGGTIPADLNYPVQVWNFGNQLAMVNLAGEVVVDYSTRLKNELGGEHLWINAYSNDVPCYIASRRVIREGGYEAESSMYYYDKPSPFVEEVEDKIVTAVHDLMPASFKEGRATVNQQQLVTADASGTLSLAAADAATTGPNIKFMPDWQAFGWFTTQDQAEWEVQIDKKSKYNVFLVWSVSDAEAGKSFVVEAGSKKVKGKIGKTGSWFTYRKDKIGTLSLEPGRQKIVFKSNAPEQKGSMLDLRQIVLVPVH